MSCRWSNILEYTFTSLLSVTIRPVSSFTSRIKASCSVSTFRILPPGNYHCPLTGSFFRRRNKYLSSFNMTASTEEMGSTSTINSYRLEDILPVSTFEVSNKDFSVSSNSRTFGFLRNYSGINSFFSWFKASSIFSGLLTNILDALSTIRVG